jgi:hypothetical protein
MRIELTIGKIGAEHQQHIAIEHRIVTGGEADQTGHSDIVRVVPLDVFLAAQCVHHRRLQTLAQVEEQIVRPLTA